MKKILFPFLLLLLNTSLAYSQLVVSTPAFPSENDSVLIIYDATEGNGELANVPPPIYAHTGVITNLSSSPSDWKHVIADWTVNTDKAKLTPLGNNLYEFKVSPDIRSFYGVTGSEKVMKLAMVFRNADGSKVGRTTGGGDIFIDVIDPGLSVKFLLPEENSIIAELNDIIDINVVSSEADTLRLFKGQVFFDKVAGNAIVTSIQANTYESYWVRAVATNDTGSVVDSFYVHTRKPVTYQPLPSGMLDGINYVNDSTVTLVFYAPGKQYCFVTADFNGWMPDSVSYMYKTPDNQRYWLTINNLIPGKEYIYQYFLDGEIRVGDPYAEKTSDPADSEIPSSTYPGLLPFPAGKINQVATVLQTNQQSYQWNITNFQPPDVTDLVVYELLVRDFVAARNFQTIIDTLSYLQRLGINALELMPVMEFENNNSWGYNPSFFFATDKYYGPKNELKRLIDSCHARGIAVILDIVLNHAFGQSPMVRMYWDAQAGLPSYTSPWFNRVPKHDYNVGYDFNHESQATKDFTDRLVRFWISEYNIDGYRFDLSKGLTQKNTLGNVAAWGQYDPTRVAILTRIADTIRDIKPDALLILEHFADNPEEEILSDYGFMLWGNLNYNYLEASMGYISGSDFSYISYQKRGWNDPHVMGYMESHDEERMMFKNLSYGNSNAGYDVKVFDTSLQRAGLAACFFFTVPGPKMIWQFGELGYSYSIEYGGKLSPKPVRWDFYDEWRRRHLYDVYAALIDLKKKYDVFRTDDYDISFNGPVKSLHLNHNTMDVVVLGNFDIVALDILPGFQHTGMWYEFFTGDSLDVTDLSAEIAFGAGEYRLYTSQKINRPPLNPGLGEPGVGTSLVIVYPNPSQDVFHFDFYLTEASEVDLTIYDITGKVMFRDSSKKSAGNHIMTWDAKAAGQNQGIYFYVISTETTRYSGKILQQ